MGQSFVLTGREEVGGQAGEGFGSVACEYYASQVCPGLGLQTTIGTPSGFCKAGTVVHFSLSIPLSSTLESFNKYLWGADSHTMLSAVFMVMNKTDMEINHKLPMDNDNRVRSAVPKSSCRGHPTWPGVSEG